MKGVSCKEFLFNNSNDKEELVSVVEEACKEVLGRTGGVGFPVLYKVFLGSKKSSIKSGESH